MAGPAASAGGMSLGIPPNLSGPVVAKGAAAAGGGCKKKKKKGRPQPDGTVEIPDGQGKVQTVHRTGGIFGWLKRLFTGAA